ncbi:MAG: MoaD/ThiS family protein [Jaaginema sp. PMC 1079.18]|nr:MoaD/ThiS family protein [Jaaginema sp. PMC 1080.18]MEC4854161.1 MoaD/ThiS family protein [Jaaginema sp. PMC 1079.18]MEC4868767.1 MoaD/ThiS family protein [Jaaginema sp. PMC 1078.18]
MTKNQERIKITVKLFAAYQEAYNQSEIILELPENAPVAAVLDHAIASHPELEKWRSLTRFGINYQFVSADTLLKNGDEVVLIPPVSGGNQNQSV